MIILGIGAHLSSAEDITNINQRALFGRAPALGELKNPQICIGWN
jgi:hypothetical protein